MTNGIAFASREYKLLLDPAKLPAGPLHKAARALWRDRIAPHLGEAGIGEATGEFETAKQRRIVFRDTADGMLDRHSLVLRDRRKANGKGELTLKLRVADLMIAAAREIAASGTSSELEEDIAPLANMVPSADGRPVAVLADPPSIRSRFARSADVELGEDDHGPSDLTGVAALYQGFAQMVDTAGEQTLFAGPVIREEVSKGQEAQLAGGARAAFTVSLWYLADDATAAASPPLCAEISFKVELGGATMSLADATSAASLFLTLQRVLGTMLELRFLSKTALALPVRAERP